jgi:lipopolysaccharide export system permease protein
MNKTLFGYIAREMLLYFFICFLFFFLVFFVNQILLMAEDILSKRAPLSDVFFLVVYALPSIIATSAPFAALVGTLMGIGRLVSDREILSMNALGISLHFVLLPVLAVGILISVGSFLTNDILLPAGTIQFNKLYRKILTSTPALELESNTIKRNQNAIVVTGTIRNGIMDSLLVIDSTAEGKKRIISSTDAVIVKSTNDAVLMTLQMNNALVSSLDMKDNNSWDVFRASNITYSILTKNILSSYSTAISPREMSSLDLFREIQKKKNDPDKRTLNMYQMEFSKKFSIPFGAFFFVIIAFPLGMTSRSNGQSAGFILGLLIAVLYWAFLIGGQTLSLRLGLNGTFMMWLPNILVLVFGFVFMGRKIFQ